MINFPSGQLEKNLQELEQTSFDGGAEITVEVAKSQLKYSKILIFSKGKLVFADLKLLTPQELAHKIGSQLNISIIDAAVKTSETKVKNPNSFQEMFTFLSRMRIIKPQQIEAFLLQNIILALEQLLPYDGTLQTDSQIEFDLAYGTQEIGWSIKELSSKLAERQPKWQKLAQVGITSSEAIPKLNIEVMNNIADTSAQKHCRQWIDGQKSIGEIAEKTQQDPLKLAHEYYKWVQQKWIYFGDLPANPEPYQSSVPKTPEKTWDLPTVLSVDDSPVVQTMLKRALCDRYEVLLANNGMEALKMLNSKKDIKLVLLDVTMPDIDGIELCRTIRRFKKFQNLPIVMLTAKDGMFDKVKGKFAGSTEYLTKPVDREALLSTVQKYVPSLAVNQPEFGVRSS